MASKDLNHVLCEQLKCRICESGPKAGKSEWYQCLSHHHICQDCKTKDLSKCPCGRFISAEHSPIMEEMLKLETTRFKCKNTKIGCREFLGKEAMIFHEAECIYRFVKCPKILCESQEMPFHELFSHITKEKHEQTFEFKNGKIQVDELTEEQFAHGGFSSPLCKLLFDEHIFYVMDWSISGTYYHWVHFVGSPHEAKNYSYTSEFFGNDSFRSHVYTSKVIPIDETADSIKKKIDCFVMPFEFMKNHFIDENRKYKFCVKIRNLKQEVKDENEESGVSDVDE